MLRLVIGLGRVRPGWAGLFVRRGTVIRLGACPAREGGGRRSRAVAHLSRYATYRHRFLEGNRDTLRGASGGAKLEPRRDRW